MTASRFAAALFVATLLFSAVPSKTQQTPAQQTPAQPQARLAAPIANTARATLAGSQPPRARMAQDVGAVDSSMPLQSITMHFSRSTQQQADLDALIAAQQDPSSPQYHQWLTPADFGARFGLADADIAKTQAWLQSQGFNVISVSPSRNSVTFSGTASTASSAFGAPLHRYTLNGENHIAPSADLSLPAALASIIADIRGLSDFRPHPHFRRGNGALYKPNFTSAQTGNHFLTPGDIAVIYDIKAAYGAGFNGSGLTIAIMGQSQIVNSDITNFQTAIGQTAKPPISILVPNTGASQVFSLDESESDLDLEYSTGIAPGATINLVYVGSNQNSTVFDSLTWAIQNRIAPILNISYGQCEPDLPQGFFASMNATLQQAAAQGQTVVSAAGDDGSTDCFDPTNASTIAQTNGLAVDFPSSSPFVTAVGGTEFTAAAVATGNNQYFTAAGSSDVVTSALSYIPEQAWNDDSAAFPTDPLSAGGGGASIFATAPTWQTGVPGIPAGTTMRLLPDIALNSSPNNAAYAYCTSDQSGWVQGQVGSCTSGLRDSSSQDLTLAGGTSFAAPIFSGMVAILGQAKGYTYQGLVNPTLYTIASNPTTYASAFHDITVGNNTCSIGATYCSPAGAANFNTSIGYDQATGLGSIDLNNLLTAWPKNTAGPSTAKAFTLAGTAVSLTQSSNTASATGTSTITVTPVNGYTGTIAWTVTSSNTISIAQVISSVCYSIPGTTVSGSSPVTATLTFNVGGSSCASGTAPLVRKGTQSAATHQPTQPGHHSPAIPALATLGIVSLLFIGRRNRRPPALLAVLLLAGAGFGLSGCGGGATSGGGGGGGGGTGGGPITYNDTVTVIGTDSANNVVANTSFAFTLTVQ
jgi:subtilase family serine protease